MSPRVKNFSLHLELDSHDVITLDIPAGRDEREAVLDLLEHLGVSEKVMDYF